MSGSPATITVPIRFKNSTGTVSQASVATLQLVFADPGAAGLDGPSIDVSGYTSFVKNTGGVFTPANTTLTAITNNVTSPTYAWAITGATPSTSSASSVVVTPLSASTKVDVTLTVGGSNLASPITKAVSMPVVYDGATGQTGANGVMSAFPTIFPALSLIIPVLLLADKPAVAEDVPSRISCERKASSSLSPVIGGLNMLPPISGFSVKSHHSQAPIIICSNSVVNNTTINSWVNLVTL